MTTNGKKGHSEYRVARSGPDKLAPGSWQAYLGCLLPVLGIAVLAAVFYTLNSPGVFESPVLLATLNTFFCGAVGLMVAYLAAENYRITGSLAVLLMGAGAMAFAVTYLVAGLLLSDLDAAIIVHNGGLFLAATFFAGSAGVALTRKSEETPNAGERYLVLAYATTLVLMVLLITCAVIRVIPAFYIPGQGMTPLRQVVLGVTVLEFLLASVCIGLLFRVSRTRFLMWYGMGLLLIALGLGILIFEGIPATPLSWIGRAAQYMGGVYLLIATFSLFPGAMGGIIPLEKALRASEERFRIVVETAPDAIVVYRNHTFLYANDAALRLFGIENIEDLVKHDIMEMVTPEDHDHVTEWLKSVQRGRKTPLREARLRRFDGRVVDVEFLTSPIEYDGGPAILAVLRDITERKAIEVALRNSEEEYRSLVENAPASIYEIDRNGLRFRRVNDVMCRILGYTREELLGMNPQDILDDDSKVRFRDRIQKIATGEDIDEATVYRVFTKAGHEIWVTLNVTINTSYGGSALCIAHDITERKRSDDELQRKNEQLNAINVQLSATKNELQHTIENLKRSNQELEQFAYVASHDLREPLRMVTIFSQLLEHQYRGKLDEDADEFIRYIINGGKRMDELVNDLLEFSRITSQAKPFEPTDMNAVVYETLQNLSAARKESGVAIHSDTLPTVFADRSQMVQVFQNLISNAVKFRGKDNPGVGISAIQQSKDWVFSVSDNGIGINPVYRDKIFEIFKRLHTEDKYPGTGIGLAICRRIIERHGGRIWVESEEGRGSTFFFTIPVSDELHFSG
jgi:PAS domain S-box-containing protein